MIINESTPTEEPVAAGNYAVTRLVQDFVFVSGMTPKQGTRLLVVGRIGDQIHTDEARQLAGIATHRALTAADAAAAKAGKIFCGVASMTVFVAVVPDYTRISEVADGASAVLEKRFGRIGLPSRTAVGVAGLPGGAPVEVQLVGIVQ